ncbi:hypothetical protein ACC692_38200, partial [Rhizobium ruizarguesonis]
AKTADELTDHLRLLWLTPAMDGLFTGASSDRRRFLDRLVLSLDAGKPGGVKAALVQQFVAAAHGALEIAGAAAMGGIER